MPRRHEGFKEYCAAQDPNRARSNASCVLTKGHSVGVQHKDLDGKRWSDASGPEPQKPTKRTRLKPSQWTGWKPEHTVEVELIERVPKQWSLYAVYLNGDRIGWAHGYSKSRDGQASWAYVRGVERPSVTAFGYHTGDSRQMVVEYLVEETLRCSRS
jgi:hypothetical protein